MNSDVPLALRRRAGTAGTVAVVATVGASEVAAALLPGARSLLLSVGDVVIDHVPGWLERATIALLGAADKPVLVASVLVVSLMLGAALGRLALRRPRLAAAGFLVFSLVGAAASLSDPRTAPGSAVAVAALGALAGIATLRLLLRTALASGSSPTEGGGPGRRLVLTAGGVTAAAVVAGVGAPALAGRGRVARARAAVRLPAPTRTAAPPAPSAVAGVVRDLSGLTPQAVANEDFYRIDTALSVPQVDPSGWSLEVGGMVDRPFTLTYDELLALPMVEAFVTLSCVSNEIGGDLVGNARWQGVRLEELLERAGMQDGADQVFSRSVDGFTAGFPPEAARGTDAMVAIAMNGEPLPAVHGFPARLVVPGLYGYVSATKWLASIELTTFDRDEGFWIPRGWSAMGPVRTQSRIDVPRPFARVAAGPHTVGGVAWAPTRGIRTVEVSVDGRGWAEADLLEDGGDDSWRRWVWRWDAPAGRHRLAVRATDGDGYVQTAEPRSVAPDGATGHHTVEVHVA